jgi:hypothetical protein
MPKFPVLLDTGERLFSAMSKAQLEAKVSQLAFSGKEKRDIIDLNAEGFAFYPESEVVAPVFRIRRWTKGEIIDLYNGRRQSGQPELGKASLGNRSLERVIKEVVQLLTPARHHR